MKKVFKIMCLGIACFMISLATVSAALYWTSGYTFFEKGTEHTVETTQEKEFISELALIEKYTDPVMTFKVGGKFKNSLGIWANLLKSNNLSTDYGTNSISNVSAVISAVVLAPATTDFKVTWEQTSDGRLSCYISNHKK